MAKQVQTRITVSGKKIAAYLKTMEEDQNILLVTIAGITDKYVHKISDFGSAIVFSGMFGAIDPGTEKAIIEGKKLILPVEVSTALQKYVDKKEGPVRFRADIAIKKSGKSPQGYFLKITWTKGPEILGQMDLVRDLLKDEPSVLTEEAKAIFEQTHSFS